MKSGQILQFPLTRGLDEDGNPKSHALATLKTGNNIRWPRNGVIGKRFGTRKVGGFQAPTRFVTRGAELSAIDSGALWTYDPIADDAASVASVSDVALEWSTLADDELGVTVTDAAVSGDLLVQAWVTGDPTQTLEAEPAPDGLKSGNAYVQIINRITGQVLLSPLRISSSVVDHVRVLISGGQAFVVFSAGATIVSRPITLATLTVETPQTLIADRIVAANNADHANNGRFDAVFLASGDLALVFERYTTADSVLTAARFTLSTFTFSSAVSVDHTDGTYVEAVAIAIAEDVSGAQLMILYSHHQYAASPEEDDGNLWRVRLRAVNSTTMAALVSVVTVESTYHATQVSIARAQANTALCAWSGQTTTSHLPSLITERWLVDGTATAVAHTRHRSMSMALLSRLFLLGTFHAYACDGRGGVADDGGSFNVHVPPPSTFLLRIDWQPYSASIPGVPPHTLKAKVDHDIGGHFQGGCLPQGAVVDASTVLGLLPFQADAAPEAWNWRTGLRLVRATVDPDLIPDQWKSVSVGQETYIAGGFLGAWDGCSSFDYGMRAPVIIKITGSGFGGHLENGTYIYQFAPGYRSRAGVLHRGPLSDTIESLFGGMAADADGPNGSAVIKVCSHGIDGKQTALTGFANASAGSVFLDSYRTEVNGSVLYQLSMPPRYNVFLNDPTAGTIDFTDTAADTDLRPAVTESPDPGPLPLNERPEPYTASGELEDCQPPAQYTILLHNGRLFLVTGSRREIWFSKDIKENPGMAPGFSPDQIELYEQRITALASLDDKRIVFWARGLWYVDGDGPNVSGLDNRFSAPRVIQSDVGCTNPRSVVSGPMGVLFQCGTDLYLLDRNLTVSWIGKNAQDTLVAFPVITSAVLVASHSEIRFTCNNAAGDAGLVLVFDYQRETWFTRTYPGNGPIMDAVLHEGVYYLALRGVPAVAEDQVRYEDPSIYYDVLEVEAEDDDDPHVTENTFAVSTVELEAIGPIGLTSPGSIGPVGAVGWQRVRIAKLLGESLSNHAMAVSVARDFSTTYEQTENFVAGSAFTTPGAHARCEVALRVQRRQAVQLKFVDAAPANTTLYPLGNGAGFQFEGVALLVQPKPGMPRDTSSRRGG